MTWAPDYATVADLRNYLRIDDTADDLSLANWVTTVSRNIDDHCGRQFGQVAAPEARSYTAIYDRHLGAYVADIDDLMDTGGFTLADANSNAITDYSLEPYNAVQKGRPYERILLSVGGKLTATALWGWTAVPAAVKTGLFLQAARLAARRDSPFGIAGSPSEGSEIRLLAQLDPDFKTSLKPFVRKWWAA